MFRSDTGVAAAILLSAMDIVNMENGKVDKQKTLRTYTTDHTASGTWLVSGFPVMGDNKCSSS